MLRVFFKFKRKLLGDIGHDIFMGAGV